jgi:hypothetical protein
MTLEPFVKAGWSMAPKQGLSNLEAGGTLSRIASWRRWPLPFALTWRAPWDTVSKKYPACIDMLAGVCISSDAPEFDSRAMVRRCGAFSETLNFCLDNAASSAGRARQKVGPMGEEGLTL